MKITTNWYEDVDDYFSLFSCLHCVIFMLLTMLTYTSCSLLCCDTGSDEVEYQHFG